LARGGFGISDPAAAYIDELCEHWSSSGAKGGIAFVDWPGYFAANVHFLQRYVKRVEHRGVPALACDLSQLRFVEGRLLDDKGTHCTVVVANYLLEDAIRHGVAPLEPLLQAARRGDLRLVMGLH